MCNKQGLSKNTDSVFNSDKYVISKKEFSSKQTAPSHTGVLISPHHLTCHDATYKMQTMTTVPYIA
jgi:hypothetical protein